MSFINLTADLEITINGQNYGLICPLQMDIGCCNINGTYYWYYQNGDVRLCSPTYNSESGKYEQIDCIGGSHQPEKVYCDPCANKCSKDSPSKLSYSGSHKWLFDMYIGNSQTISGIKLAEWTVTGGYDGTINTSDCNVGKLCVNGKCVCCSASPEQVETVHLGTISKDITELLKTFTQPYITPGAVDPTEYCNCYCAGCGPIAFGGCNTNSGYTDLGSIINMLRESESKKCS